MKAALLRPRTLMPFALAAAIGVFISVASHELNWSETTTVVVTTAIVVVLALFGTPLVLLSSKPAPSDRADHQPKVSRREQPAKAAMKLKLEREASAPGFSFPVLEYNEVLRNFDARTIARSLVRSQKAVLSFSAIDYNDVVRDVEATHRAVARSLASAQKAALKMSQQEWTPELGERARAEAFVLLADRGKASGRHNRTRRAYEAALVSADD